MKLLSKTILLVCLIGVGTLFHLNKQKTMNTKTSALQPGIYKHYKNNYYKVIGTGTHTETHEVMVYYQALYGEYGFWLRPISMFTENVIIDGRLQPRFEFVSAY